MTWAYVAGLVLAPLSILPLVVFLMDKLEKNIGFQKPTQKMLEDKDGAAKIPLFRYFPILREKVAWINLGNFPTPISEMTILSPFDKKEKQEKIKIYLKREDLASTVYGGNKVRTLTHLLPCGNIKARSLGGKVITLGASGSNQIVATAAHASVQNIEVRQFALLREASSLDNSLNCISMVSMKGWLQADWASSIWSWIINTKNVILSKQDAVMNMGGNNVVGGIGHVSAIFEICDQIKEGLLPQPHRLVLPFGSGCTTSGLLAGIALARKTKTGFLDDPENDFFFERDFRLHGVIIHHVFAKISFIPKSGMKKTASEIVKFIADAGGPDATEELKTVFKCFVMETKYAGLYGKWSAGGKEASQLVTSDETVVMSKSEKDNSHPKPNLCACFSSKAFDCLLHHLEEDFLERESFDNNTPKKEKNILFWATKSLVQPFVHDLSWENVQDKVHNKKEVLDWLKEGEVTNEKDFLKAKNDLMTQLNFKC